MYLDTNIFIYAVEGIEPFASAARYVLDAVDGLSVHAVTSQLTLTEALVGPYRVGNEDAVQNYLRDIDSTVGLTVLPISRSVLLSAARLRASHVFLKLADAIHAATAIAAGCDAFLTNDDRLKGLPIEVLRLSDIV